MRAILLVILGVFSLVILALVLPTPLHDWFVDGSIGPVTADVGVMALVILFTPVTILSTILSKYDVDFDDEERQVH